MQAKYSLAMQAAKQSTEGGSVKMADFVRALEESDCTEAEQSALLQAKGGSAALENVSDEVRMAYYRASAHYTDADGSGSMNQAEFEAYVAKNGMKHSVANEVWDILWKPGKKGSTSPYA